MALTKLALLFTLLTLLATAPALAKSSEYQSLISHINANDKAQAKKELNSIASELTNLLAIDLEKFHRERKSLLDIMRRDVKDYKGYHWFKKIEKSYQSLYLQKGVDLILSSTDPKLSSIQEKLKHFMSHKSKNLHLSNKLIYANGSRGSYHAHSNTVSIELLPMDEFINVLTHEVSHFNDDDLNKTRLNLASLRVESEKSNQSFGYYWFLKSTYLQDLKEIVPRVDACLAYVSLVKDGLVENSYGRSSQRYWEVIAGVQTCHGQVQGELEGSKLSFFWSSGSSEYNFVLQAYKDWHERNNLVFPFLDYR